MLWSVQRVADRKWQGRKQWGRIPVSRRSSSQPRAYKVETVYSSGLSEQGVFNFGTPGGSQLGDIVEWKVPQYLLPGNCFLILYSRTLEINVQGSLKRWQFPFNLLGAVTLATSTFSPESSSFRWETYKVFHSPLPACQAIACGQKYIFDLAVHNSFIASSACKAYTWEQTHSG